VFDFLVLRAVRAGIDVMCEQSVCDLVQNQRQLFQGELLGRRRVLLHRDAELPHRRIEPRPQRRGSGTATAGAQLVGQGPAGQAGLTLPPLSGFLVPEVRQGSRLAGGGFRDLTDPDDEGARVRRAGSVRTEAQERGLS
jgi:hypothetical protein